ncbi:MAG: hypothetical protein ACTHJL_11855 [Amnibacterium sp.]
MIRDEQVVRAAQARGQYAPAGPGALTYLFDAGAYRAPAGRGGSYIRCAVVVPLPSSDAPKPWLYLEPDDADDYLDQLDAFLEDEVQAAGLVRARQEVVEGIRFLHLAPYGFERASGTEHERLLDEVGPGGRYDPRIE